MLVIVLGATRRNGPTGRSATREEELGPYSPTRSAARRVASPGRAPLRTASRRLGPSPGTPFLDSAPPALSPEILVAFVPALVAATFAATSWSIGAMSDARLAPLREGSTGGARSAAK